MAGGLITGGGGDAWSKDHEAILEHAKGLGYGRHSGKSYPSVDAPKSEWISWADGFNAWKDAERAKSTPIWATDPGDVAPSPPSSGGGGGSSAPYAANPFFPQLVPEYTPQGLLDWSGYMPAGGMFGHEQYQPWTNPNAIPENLFYYQPPTIHAGGGISGGGYSGGSSGSVSYTPVGNISTGSSSDSDAVFTPFMADAPVLGTQGKDTGHTLEELVIMSDPSTSAVPTTFPVLNATSELQAEMANQIINQHVTQGLIDYKPELERDFEVATHGYGGAYAQDQAQARIEQAALDLLKAQPKAILGGNLSTGSPVSMIWNSAIPTTASMPGGTGASYVAQDAHLARPDM
jgi:hypothetical protein